MVTTRPMPEDFHLYAGKEAIRTTMARYRAGDAVVRRWYREADVQHTGHVFRVKRPMPDDFPQVAPGKTCRMLEERYNAGEGSVRRWLAACGVKPRQARISYAADRDFKSSFEPTIDPSIAGQAQRFLQKTASVYKAEVAKKGAAGWVVWGKLMSTEQMMAKAESLGWSADSWTRLAA